MSSKPQHPPADGHQIDWVRAAFAGSIAGGVLWAVVIKVVTILDKTLSVQVRLGFAVGAGCLPLLVAGAVWYWLARQSAVRTYAAALLIAPCTGLVLMLILLALGVPDLLTRR